MFKILCDGLSFMVKSFFKELFKFSNIHVVNIEGSESSIYMYVIFFFIIK